MRIIFLKIIPFIIIFHSVTSGQSDSLTEMNPPILTEYVTDETGTLTKEQTDSLRSELRSFFDTTSTQIVVYMIRTLKGESLESASYSIAQKNGIGTKNNNGVLLFIVKDDRKIRIEVGYGLEGILTDARAGRIISERIAPYFKKDEFYRGIKSGVNEIIYIVHFEKFITPLYNQEEEQSISVYKDIIIIVISIIVFFAAVLALIYVSGRSGGTGGTGSSYRTSSGSSSSSSAYRSISSGSSSGSRGFSGGGGSFGGGGASGSW